MSLASQLKNLDVTKLKYKNTNKSYGGILKSEANRLANIIQYNLDKFYDSYSPIVYERTFDFYNSLYVDDLVDIKVRGNQLIIDIKRDEGSFKKSLFSDSKVDLFWLLEDGYQVKKDVWFRDIEYFGWRKPADIIKNSLEEFQRSNTYNLTININKPLLYYS